MIEEPESHYSVDDTTGANQSEFMVSEESRNDEFNTTFHGDHQEEEHNIPEVHKETVRIFALPTVLSWDIYLFDWFLLFNYFDQVPGVLEQEHHVVSPSNNNTVIGEGETRSNEAETRTDKKGKTKRARKRKSTSEAEPNKSPEKKKKFKHSSRRQKNRTCNLAVNIMILFFN